jgi:hypothetical protein
MGEDTVPKGIKVLSNIYYISCFVGLIAALVLLINVFTPYLFSGPGKLNSVLDIIFYLFLFLGIALSSVSGITGIWGIAVLLTLINTNYFALFAVVVLAIFAPLNFVMGYGIKREIRWVRNLSLVIYVLGLIGSISILLIPKEHWFFLPSFYYGLLGVAFCIGFLFYQLFDRKVRKFFDLDY